MTDTYDALIAGAGMTGRITALALAEAGLGVLLIGEDDGTRDPRTTALAYGTARALRRLGVWEGLEDAAQAVREIRVGHAVAPDRFRKGAYRESLSFDDGLLPDPARWAGEPLAYLVRNDDLASALRSTCERAEIPEMTARFAGRTAEAVSARLDLEGGGTASGALVVACDGARSPLRRAAGLAARVRETDQDALTFTASPSRPQGTPARQAFLPGGPVASLPLTGGEVSIVWTMPRAEAAAWSALPPQELADRAAGAFGGWLGDLEARGPVARFPLRPVTAPKLTSERLALVGEAGHTLHPLAGGGFNLAVGDALALADVLGEAARAGMDLGHGTVLDGYDRARGGEALAQALGNDALARVLSSRDRAVRGLASLGFGLVQRSDALRAWLARRAGAEARTEPPAY